ncbi:MAG: hypothetical protein U0V72_02130 [Cytophagales bacterium]
MEQRRFLEIIQNPAIMNKSDMAELMDIKNNFPYVQLSYTLLSLLTYRNKSLYYDEHLRNASLRTNSRIKLKSLLDTFSNEQSINKLGSSFKSFSNETSEDSNRLSKDSSLDNSEQSIESQLSYEFLLKVVHESQIINKNKEKNKEPELATPISEIAPANEEMEEDLFGDFTSDAEEVPVTLETNSTEEVLFTVEKISNDEITSITNEEINSDIQSEKSSKNTYSSILHGSALDNYRIQNIETNENSFHDFLNSYLENYSVSVVNLPKNDVEESTENVEEIPNDLFEVKEDFDNAIDKFLNSNFNKPKRVNPLEEDQSPKTDLSQQYTSNSEEFYSESLAKIYEKQRKYTKAIETYKKLMLVYPQKSVYFASKISEIENLI